MANGDHAQYQNFLSVGHVADFNVYDGHVYLLRRDGHIWLGPNGHTRRLGYCLGCDALPFLLFDHSATPKIYQQAPIIIPTIISLLFAILGFCYRKKLNEFYQNYRSRSTSMSSSAPPSSRVDTE
jgi:hypothetical protein